MQNAVQENGIGIVRTPTGIGVALVNSQRHTAEPLTIEVDYAGRRLKQETFDPREGKWRDYYPGLNMLACGVRVKKGEQVLAELSSGILPWMVLQGEQRHITESYVSVPPALHITDEVGAVWTLGFTAAKPDESPRGEYAFNVLRDGVDTGEMASRIERRGGKVRIFTRFGMKTWSWQSFF